MSQNDNARRFLDAYASIEHDLSTMARETRYIPFSQLLSMCAKHSWVVSHHQEELREFNELRNAIVHLRDSRNEIIAQPTDQAVQDIERLAKLLTGDDTLLQYASKPVKTVSLQDTIPSAYTLMKKLGSSKVPVYENGIYRGLLQMEDICAWAMDGRDALLQVKDVLSSSRKERVVFLNRGAKVMDAMASFEKALRLGAAAMAIIITENAERDQQPLGIVTVQDLPKMLRELV